MPHEGEASDNRTDISNDFSGRAEAVVQAGSIAGGIHLHPAQPAPAAPPHELPPDVHAFTDRVEQLAQMDLLLTSTLGTPSTAAVVISAVSGTAGVGKTAFATHWAHRVSDRFPGGQLYVNLRGYGPDHVVSAHEALASLLRSLGIASPDIPLELDDRAARFRSLAAGRRMLVVLDNARSAEQVRPLLPGTSSCLVLVTSRDTLPGLVSRDGARRMNLDLLPQEQAIDLLRILIGARVDDEITAAHALVLHCARLPLALRIAADLASSSPDTSLGELVENLADEQGRLDLLDAGADPYTAVRAVLSWSYRGLPPDEARTLRLLGLHPGRDFTTASAAVLMETTPARARHLLDRLVRAHLVERTRTKRYQMHDLLRVYAADLVAQEEPPAAQESAMRRLFDFFLQTTSAAMTVLFPQEDDRRPVVPRAGKPGALANFTAEEEAAQWLEAERPTLLAIAARTTESTWAIYASTLSSLLYRFLDIRGHFDDAVTLHTYAVAASRQQGDPAAEGCALHNLGTVYQRLGRYQESVTHLEQALKATQRSSRGSTEAQVESDLGLTLLLLGRYESALAHLGRALQLFKEQTDLTGQGQTLNNIGLAYFRQERFAESLDHLQRSLVLFRTTEDRPRQGYALNDIGVIYQKTARHSEALDFHQEALLTARETGDRALEAAAFNALGNTHRGLATEESVLDFHNKALAIAQEIGDRYEEAQALEGLANADEELGHDGEARRRRQEALTIYIDLGSPDTKRLRRILAEQERRGD
jgi:tetratricopeptide (TPR) repeat protein